MEEEEEEDDDGELCKDDNGNHLHEGIDIHTHTRMSVARLAVATITGQIMITTTRTGIAP